MDNWKRYVRLQIACADPQMLISQLAENGVELLALQQVNALTNVVTIRYRQLDTVQSVLKKYGGSCREVGRKGMIFSFIQFLGRPVLVAAILFFLVMLLLTTDRIFFIHVIGNDKISTEAILSQAQMHGLEFGVKAAEIRSEELKNALLGNFTQLQWLGITTSGTVATIHVSERSIPNQSLDTDYRGIYSTGDGIISSIVAERGTPIVRVGQRVKTGDLLITGYSDCGIKLRVEQPIGEVHAYTLRNLEVLTTENAMIRADTSSIECCYRVRIGKKVINFCNHSGIHDTSCVKMYEEYYWTLPGGFCLPVSVTKVINRHYDLIPAETDEVIPLWIQEYARKYLHTQMIAGQILEEKLTYDSDEGVCKLQAIYACQEMIGQAKNEETFDRYAEDN